MRADRRKFKDKQDKEYLAIHREHHELSKLRWSRSDGEFVDVEPYQYGWTRTFELRDDAKNRRDANVLHQILDMINVTQFSRSKDFLVYDPKLHKKVPRPMEPETLSPEQYAKLGDRHRKFFIEDWEFHKGSHSVRHFYRFTLRYYFVMKVTPNIVTQQWIPNEAVKTRYAELHHYISRNNLWPKIDHLLGNSRYRDINMAKYRNECQIEFDDSDVWE